MQDCNHQGLAPFLDKAEKDKSGQMAKLERVKSFRINVVHWKDHAVKQHECNTCGRPLNQQELQHFLARQVIFPGRIVRRGDRQIRTAKSATARKACAWLSFLLHVLLKVRQGALQPRSMGYYMESHAHC